LDWLKNDAVFFEDSLKKGYPYIARKPRDHESLFFVKKGNLLYERDGKKVIIKEGEVGYIAKGSSDSSGAYMCDEVSYYAVNFCFDKTFEHNTGNLPFPVLCSKGSLNYPYGNLFRKATLECSLKNDGADYLVNGVLMEIIGYLFKELKIYNGNVSKFKKIHQAVEYMKLNSENADLQISDLSAIAGMSEKNFRRIFKDVYGQTPYAFLQKYRVEKAGILLTNTDRSISEIALSCGFSDVYSFSHCFKRHLGISPQGYRTKETKE
jgi:AraC-like DNA-binding protein